jgi:hypothetical protein
MPLLAREMKARASIVFCLEKKRHPACFDESFRNLKMPIMARDMETRASVTSYLLKKLLSSRINESL